VPTDFAVICVLHGDPVLPPWLEALGPLVHLVINDPGPGRYVALPAVREVWVNDRPRGFAANVNAAFDRIDTPAVVCVNFDLTMSAEVPGRLVAELSDPLVAVVGPVLRDARGDLAFSVGSGPTALKEFTRAAGLRSGRPQRVVRAVLRRLPRWQQRNEAARILGPLEYLPWTCVAVRREAWDAVGPLDEQFEMYAEDLDWGRRASQAGWSARLVDVGTVIHEERATRSPATDELYERSHALLHAKWDRPDFARWQQRGRVLRRLWSRASD
jgi:GT2 family glycosyltransferase